jgi:twitching motility protein PilT
VPQLDRLLEALVDRSAEELILDDGRQPAFRYGEELRPVSKRKLNRAQIAALLTELGDQIQAARIEAGQSARFVYNMSDRPFECEVTPNGEALNARVRPAVLVEAARPEGAPGKTAPTPPAAVPAQPETTQLETASAPPPGVDPARSEAETAPSPPAAAPAQPETTQPDPASPPPPCAAPADSKPTSDGTSPPELTASSVAPTASASIPVAPRSPEMERYLMKIVETGASDLHLSAGEVPMIRHDGEMSRLPDEPALDAERTRSLLESMMPEYNRDQFRETHDTDFGYEIPDVSRFRANVFMDRKGPGGVFRIIPAKILTAEQLGLPEAVLELCRLSKGLVLVTGPTGSGKSTTLAAMIDYINSDRSDHIITIEDPIEFVHPNRKCLVNQREVVTHTSGFKKALRAALREDPDIVLVGEMRDLETIAIAIETAETGHLVFGTLHTTTACSTVDRIIDQFPADRQAQIRTMLAESIKGVVSQTLLKKLGGGRVAALEILVVTPAISNLIREGKTFQIPSLMQTGRNLGMQLLNDALLDLVRKKLVAPEEAYLKAIDKKGLASQLAKVGIRLDIGQAS